MKGTSSCNNLFNKLICIVLLISISHLKTANSARVDINDMDYDSLMSMLAEAENLEKFESDDDQPEANSIPQYYFNPSEHQQNPQQPQQQQQIEVGQSQNGKRVSSNIDFTITKPSASSLLAPHVEVLHIIEACMKLKGEMASRIHALINDNFDLFRSIYNLIISKISKLHSFTLVGISVIRRILEFAVQMIGTWEINAPSLSFGFDKLYNLSS